MTEKRKKPLAEGEKRPPWRPSEYDPAYCEQARKLCLLGATDADLANFFGVDERTVNRWKNDHDGFCQSIKAGKMQADAEVADRLYQRALGYTHPSEKVFQSNGQIIRAETIEHYPPDTQAASLWLRNRRPQNWRDKQDVEHSGEVRVSKIERVIVDPTEGA